MPWGLKRYQQTHDLHFVTFSCHQRKPYLSSQEARDIVESSIERMRLRYRFFVAGFVIMPEHVHLLLSEPEQESLAGALKGIKVSASKQLPPSPFWQPRYYDFNVFTERRRIEKLKYMHRNPVKRGLVERPEDWLSSSFQHFLTGEEGRIEIESPWTAARRTGETDPG